jgi:hypothetical protein
MMTPSLRRAQLLKTDFQGNVLRENNSLVAVSNLTLVVIFLFVLDRIWFGKISLMIWTSGLGLFWVGGLGGGGGLLHKVYWFFYVYWTVHLLDS